MPKLSPQKIKENERDAKRAREIYADGYSIRAVARLMKRKKSWVGRAIKEGSPQETMDGQGTT